MEYARNEDMGAKPIIPSSSEVHAMSLDLVAYGPRALRISLPMILIFYNGKTKCASASAISLHGI